MVSSDEHDEEGSVSGDSASMIIATRTYRPLQTDMADIKSSAKATVDRIRGPVEIAGGKMVIGNKNAIRKEKKNGDVMARLANLEHRIIGLNLNGELKELKHRLIRLDIIDDEMENLRPIVQSMRMGFLERIKKNALRNGDLRKELVKDYDDEVINTRNYYAHCGNAIQDLQLYHDGIRDDGQGALYAYVYGISTSEMLNYKEIPEITNVLSWRGEILSHDQRLPESFVGPFSKFIGLARQSQSLDTEVHQEPMISLFELLRAVYNEHEMAMRAVRDPTPSHLSHSWVGQLTPNLLRRISSLHKGHKKAHR